MRVHFGLLLLCLPNLGIAFVPPSNVLTAAVRKVCSTRSRRNTARRTAKSQGVDGTAQTAGKKNLLPDSVYDTILQGRIAVVPNFLSEKLVAELRNDAKDLYGKGHFSADALAAYGTEQDAKFDPARDRTVLKLAQWKRTDIGNPNLRHNVFGSIMANLRTDLSRNLNRPHLDTGVSTTAYGYGSTEISYTRFGPGAYLKRHVDEHHEELKGRRGWEKPTRRSVSWLVYLNEADWDPAEHGGFIRCFQRRDPPSSHVGARDNGDLQIGWLRSTSSDAVERPVFLDGRCQDPGGNCAMYTIVSEKGEQPLYITRNFHPNPILFLSGGDFFAQRLLIDNPDLAPRFHFLEPPRSAATAIFSSKTTSTPSYPQMDEAALDIPPLGGTLVMFDSVSLPHEVLPSRGRERWATSGWFHEDQQEPASRVQMV